MQVLIAQDHSYGIIKRLVYVKFRHFFAKKNFDTNKILGNLIRNSLLTALAFAMLISCSTLEKSSLKASKQATIVAFVGHINSDSPKLIQLFKSSINQKFVPKMLLMTEKSLSKKLNWSMISNQKWANSRNYQKLRESKIEKIKDFFSMNEFRISSPHLITNLEFLAEKKNRELVFKETKADVIIGLETWIEPKKAGNGFTQSLLQSNNLSIKFYEAQLEIVVYKKGKDAPIWSDRQFFAHKGDRMLPTIFGVSFENVREQQIIAAYKNALFALLKELD